MPPKANTKHEQTNQGGSDSDGRIGFIEFVLGKGLKSRLYLQQPISQQGNAHRCADNNASEVFSAYPLVGIC